MSNQTKPNKLFTTCRNQVIPIGEVECIGDLVTGRIEDDHYIIYLKSGREIWVNHGRNYESLRDCRKSLIKELENYIS